MKNTRTYAWSLVALGLWLVSLQSGQSFYSAKGDDTATALVHAADGRASGQHDCVPQTELLRATGPMAEAHPPRCSTKYQDDETDMLYYGYRYYNASAGRWLSRDPIEEYGGFNLVSFLNNNALQFTDAAGLRPIPFTFDAFINGNRRGLWHHEPLSILSEFMADDRDFGQFDLTKRNARVFSDGTIESKFIGIAERRGVTATSDTGDSTRRTGALFVHPPVVMWYWNYETKRAQIHGGEPQVKDLGPCTSEIRFTPSAGYPFTFLGMSPPSIDYDITFTFEVTAPRQVTVTLTGSHNKFPDYEGVSDGNAFYQYSSSWSGPNLYDLNTSVSVPDKKKIVINNIDVPKCCPSPHKTYIHL